MSKSERLTAAQSFDQWIEELREDIVQGEYGYEEGEFTVYPSEWRPLFDKGLAPAQAFKRALDAAAEARREDDRKRQTNWERIQREDALAAGRRALEDGK